VRFSFDRVLIEKVICRNGWYITVTVVATGKATEAQRDNGEEADGRRQEADGRRQEADGRRQEADGRRQEAGGRRQEADGGKQTAAVLIHGRSALVVPVCEKTRC
jgi:hypothetical protein